MTCRTNAHRPTQLPDGPRQRRSPGRSCALVAAGRDRLRGHGARRGCSICENAESIPPAEAFLTKLSIVALGTILIFLWFVFLSPAAFTLRRRVGIVGLVLAVLAVAPRCASKASPATFTFTSIGAGPRGPTKRCPTPPARRPTMPTVDLADTTPDDSPQFLGPRSHRDVSRRSTWPAIGRTEQPKLLWRQPIGAGWSSFAVVGHYGVTQEQRGEEELITCYDLDDGKLQWAHATPVRFQELLAGIGPRATPTIDEGKVYALGATGPPALPRRGHRQSALAARRRHRNRRHAAAVGQELLAAGSRQPGDRQRRRTRRQIAGGLRQARRQARVERRRRRFAATPRPR